MNDSQSKESDDQPVEESQPDQPEEEESSEESELLDDEDQPTEESSDEIFEIDGELLSMAEIRSRMMMQKDYTQKTQRLSEQQKELDQIKKSLISVEKKRDLTPEEKQIQDFIKQNNLMTQEEFDRKMKIQNAKQLDLQEYNAWRQSADIELPTAEAVYELGKSFPTITYPEIYRKYFGGNSVKKVVARKVVGMRGRGSDKKALGGGYSRARIAELTKKGEYDKHRDKIFEAMKKGEITN